MLEPLSHPISRPLLGLALIALGAFAAAVPSRSAREPDQKITYKTVGSTALELHVFPPENHQPTDQRSAIVFFFGGDWEESP